MTSIKYFSIPLFVLVLVSISITISRPAAIEASEPKREDEAVQLVEETQIDAQDVTIVGEDVRLSGSGNVPEIAANSQWVAIVYEQNNQVYIRAASASNESWGFAKTVGTTFSSFPDLAFSGAAGQSNIVHVVWAYGSTFSAREKQIRYAKCTLADPIISCGSSKIIASTASQQLKLPVVTVSPGGNEVHIAWFNQSTDQIQTARSANGGSTWSAPKNIFEATDGANAGQPALAATSNFVHLVFRDRDPNTGNWFIRYRRLNKSTHNVDQVEDRSNVTFSNFSEDIRNPTIAASGSNVYVAWGNAGTGSETHALTGMQSSNEGVSWPKTGGNDRFTDIPSNNSGTSLAPETKYSEDDQPLLPVPLAELGLQPNLAVKGSSFAIVWDQRGKQDCSSEDEGFSLSRIYAAWPATTWATKGPLATSGGSTDYFDVDPSIAVGGTTTHVVFLRADVSGTVSKCDGGGGSISYAVYYRGPFTKFSGNRTFLPIVEK